MVYMSWVPGDTRSHSVLGVFRVCCNTLRVWCCLEYCCAYLICLSMFAVLPISLLAIMRSQENQMMGLTWWAYKRYQRVYCNRSRTKQKHSSNSLDLRKSTSCQKHVDLVLQATFGESMTRMFVGTCALWLPCLPLFWFMRKALNSRTNTKWVFCLCSFCCQSALQYWPSALLASLCMSGAPVQLSGVGRGLSILPVQLSVRPDQEAVLLNSN